jgi:predicted RNA binding protein YcfA (HicA-like mRNA interferase family)
MNPRVLHLIPSMDQGGAEPIPSAPVAARLLRDGWKARPGDNHDVYKHPTRPGRIILPRHRTLSPGVARAVAKHAGWLD